MGCCNWNNLPAELVMSIGERLGSVVDIIRFTATCKSWRNLVEDPMTWRKYEYPMTTKQVWLLLAEEVAPGVLYDDSAYDPNADYADSTDDEEDISNEEMQIQNYFSEVEDKYNYLNNSIGSSRGLYNLSTGTTYTIDLPEAAGRLILGLNNGWILTLGSDLQINLLHPLLRHQISLPDMLTLPMQLDYDEDYQPVEAFDRYIIKAAISSENLYHHHSPSPTVVMAIYGHFYLGFTKLGDRVWTDVNVPSKALAIVDIIYHNGNFYGLDCGGDVLVFDIDGDGARGRKIASVETYNDDQHDNKKYYLVESSSGSGLVLLVRNYKIKNLKSDLSKWPRYWTTNFSAWRLNLIYSDTFEDISCSTWTKVNDLGNQAIIVGRNTSVSMPSSQTLKPNCIYFTDDIESFYHKAGGNDMGIFNMEQATIEPHFQGKSLHPISPPVWYF